jgi:hypothetical protein
MFILKSSFFVVTVLLWFNRVIIGINMHQEATRSPPKTWSLGGGVKVDFFVVYSLTFYFKNISI